MSKEKEATENTGEIIQDTTQISAMIDKILANPEIIGAVASALGPTVKNESKETGNGTKDGDAVQSSAPVAPDPSAMLDKLPELVSVIAPMLSGAKKETGGGHTHSRDRRTCLLIALKPYLCRERCETIDYMVKLGKLSEIFRNLI